MSPHRLLSFLLLVLLGASSFVQAQWHRAPIELNDPEWREGEATRPTGRAPIPAARAVAFDQARLEAWLAEAPEEWNASTRQGTRLTDSPLRLTLPIPDEQSALGWSQVAFRVVRSNVMEAPLAEKYPHISSYLIQSERDGGVTGRMDLGDHGFHAIIHTRQGAVYIDPWQRGVDNQLMVYTRKEFMASTSKRRLDCDALPMGLGHKKGEGDACPGDAGRSSRMDPPYGQTRRDYVLALACTGEYGQFHGGTVSSVLSAMNTTINRVNSIIEIDLAIRLYLSANNDDLVFLNGSNDPYTNSSTSAMLSQNQTTIDNIIGFNQYDIGHVFSTGGGGVAYLGSVCTAFKAGGVSGLPAPIGDPFDVDYVGHEMGHQFGCNHTFNNSCSGNRSSADAYEPGSGSTIMSYSGICAPNLQNLSDDVYHAHSLIEASTFLHDGFGNSCATQVGSGNSAPTVSVGASGFHIPKSTPFELTASATDPNPSTVLSYSWEQYDLGPATAAGDNNLNNPDLNAPCIRSFPPSASPTRVVPKLSSLLNNQTSFGEFLPDYARRLTFKCTVRDNNPGCGGVGMAEKTFDVDDNAGPFVVTYPNTNINRPGNSDLVVLWDVAGTDGGQVDCASVDIWFSTDGGNTWPYLLADEVANDGEHTVLLPALSTSTARLKIKGHGNIFFDVSNSNFTLTDAQGCTDSAACNFNSIASTDDGSCILPTVLYADVDGDGYGNPLITQTGCVGDLIGYVTNATDCDDSRNDVYPGAPGTQDGVDNDCSGGPLDPTEASECPEDLNNDGLVNVSDILLLLSEFGCTTDCTFDVNGVPGVNVADILLLLGAFGLPC